MSSVPAMDTNTGKVIDYMLLTKVYLIDFIHESNIHGNIMIY